MVDPYSFVSFPITHVYPPPDESRCDQIGFTKSGAPFIALGIELRSTQQMRTDATAERRLSVATRLRCDAGVLMATFRESENRNDRPV